MTNEPGSLRSQRAERFCPSRRGARTMTNDVTKTTAKHAVHVTCEQVRSWRDVLPIHPAADLFPLMSADELKTLGEDIKKNGLQTPITVLVEKRGDEWTYQLLEGRSRLDAIEFA